MKYKSCKIQILLRYVIKDYNRVNLTTLFDPDLSIHWKDSCVYIIHHFDVKFGEVILRT